MMRRLATVLFIAVVAVAIYNFWQLERMKQDLRAIRAKVHIEQPAGLKQSDDGLLVVLADVKHHSKRAKQLMADGQYKQARLEIDRSLQKLERASELSSDVAADAESALGKAWNKVRYQVRKTWKEISEDRGKGS